VSNKKKYEFKIFSQVEGHSNIENAQDEGWEIAGSAIIGYTTPSETTMMIHVPMKRLKGITVEGDTYPNEQ
jgi:phosphoribosyl-dephospho-CoA transferase